MTALRLAAIVSASQVIGGFTTYVAGADWHQTQSKNSLCFWKRTFEHDLDALRANNGHSTW